VRVEIPPLRARREDIHLLVNYFLTKFAPQQKQAPKSIASDAIAALEQYQWPGNVRELENVIRRALVMAKGDVILVSDLPPEIVSPDAAAGGKAGPAAAMSAASPPAPTGVNNPDLPAVARLLFQWARKESTLKIIPAVERELIIQALIETQGNQVQAAKLLGVTRATLRKRVEKFGIKQELAVK